MPALACCALCSGLVGDLIHVSRIRDALFMGLIAITGSQ